MATDGGLRQACAALRRGGLVAYPTEAVFGLGCDPREADAVARLVALKQRDPDQGLLLIGASFAHVAPYIDMDRMPGDLLAQVLVNWPGPQTWLLPAAPACPLWIRGRHASVGLRVTAVPLAAALCRAFGHAVVSTSANPHGVEPARTADAVRLAFGARVDAILEGPTGGLDRPTPIRDALSGATVRA